MTNGYAVHVQNGTDTWAVTATNNVGVQIDNMTNVNATNNYALRYSGTSPFAVLANGQVGVGTTAPDALLEVAGSTSYAGLHLNNPNGDLFVGPDAGGNPYVMSAGAGKYLYFHVAGAERMRVNANGNVGIGTTNPGARLDVGAGATPRGGNTDLLIGSGGDVPQLEFYGASKSGVISYDGTYMNFFTNGGAFVNALMIDNSGHLGVGKVPDPSIALDVNGSIRASTVIGAVYQDVAEWVPATKTMLPGTVVVLNRDRNNEVMPSARAYDTAVAGVVSTQPGVLLGVASASKAQIATTGRVKVKVDATKQPIKVGDLLVTSDRSGFAMKSVPVEVSGIEMHRPGTLIGKALEPLPVGEGEILVLLSLQ